MREHTKHDGSPGMVRTAVLVVLVFSGAVWTDHGRSSRPLRQALFESERGSPQSRGPARPNVVFLVDDLGYMDVGAHNPGCFCDTPNIDALARSGMRFTDGYAANPVCSPTRYSLMTGKYPTRADATNFYSGRRSGRLNCAPLNDRMPLNEMTIAELLKTKGYATFFAGTWHLGPSEEYYPRTVDARFLQPKKDGPEPWRP